MTDKPRFAVLLSGCGVFDGAEIHEAVLTLLAIDRRGGTYQCFAPDMPQMHVIDHLKGEPTGESRNVLTESARIARGAVADLATFDPADHDALILPGGFGAAKNLCTFAVDGPNCTVNPTVEVALTKAREANLPIGALCIAPAVLAKVLGRGRLTIGSDKDAAAGIEAMGATHQETTHGEIVVDDALRVVTSPCYMLDATISQIAEGADNTVAALMEMIREGATQAAE